MSTENHDAAQPAADPTTVNTVAILISDLLFILLPLLVLAIVFSFQNKSSILLRSPEWSFIAAILFGQTIIKTIIASIAEPGAYWERVVLLIAAFLVLCLVPSLLVLSLVITSDTPSSSIVITQLGLFALSVIVFFGIGGAMQKILVQREYNNKRP